MIKSVAAVAVLITLGLAAAGYSQNTYLDVKLGTLIPWNVGAGFLGDIAYGFRIDQMVSINLNAGYYMTSFQTVSNSEPISGIQTQGISSQLTANLLMFLVNARIDMPFNISEIVYPYAQAGVGYEVMINNYQNGPTNTTYVFGGFAFKIDIGTRIKLGDRTYLLVDLGYNFCGVSRGRTSTDSVIVGERIDMSGLAILGGISFLL